MCKIYVFLLSLAVFSVNVYGLSGSGTEADPWLIGSLADFNDFTADPNYWDDYTRLETDVNLVGITYTTAVIAPDMNNTYVDGTVYSGVFDGNNHTISNLTIDTADANNCYIGLFGKTDINSVITNLAIEDCNIISGIDSEYVGGLVGYNSGNISNCYASGSVSGGSGVGGLIGENWVETDGGSIFISNCYSAGSVSADGIAGGLIGASVVDDIVYSGSIFISDCYSGGSVSADGAESTAGGLIGASGLLSSEIGSSVITNCYSGSSVSANRDAGGLIGRSFDDDVSNCYATGSVSGPGWNAGLIAGFCSNVSNCYATGSVSGGHNFGLFSTLVSCYHTDSGCFWDTETSGVLIGYHGIGKTTSEMKMLSTFISAGWDFLETWGIEDNQTYPFLKLTYPIGDLNYDHIVNMLDLAIQAGHWLDETEQ
ncbi:MAG TPA: GLUG motif-containing protein [Sedimentisphaerales bacterium]|nr:GLUG motif-containing protein [Sedimentisphaerales bacterium]